ncbi:hypothetical protein HH212_20490 [Massilia forsythiae]|uniref:DUF5710 domain-containing protein n=1 Tax=Massilia forsythiae TaxID=2728020 RepID=A0A7Z2VZN7_9BURK|nr:DUF5710 domain-containing protein [Massilia forsythiae]QJE02103.1 hypothetical protein HH212_20490 [Massilia forsythiae]
MTFLNVPYAEKDEARALGARWNPGRKRWYVPDGVALEAFAKWMPEEGAAAPASAGGKGGGKPGAGSAGGRVDARAAKPVTGARYVELEHDCNPFDACAECAPTLEKSGWTAARAGLLEAIGRLRR